MRAESVSQRRRDNGVRVPPMKINNTRMWANAQRDGRPAEYRWRRLFNAAVWLTSTIRVPYSNAAKTRNPLKFAGVPQIPNGSQPLVS